ncbi:hypothetical protein [Miltoncostaea oceani]|uniref:hypothetical protein n=1 Tax=Miltoncostaea oceani TaxID=2843216 RepID=UPI001C3CFF01|nr:hypothetical protein [Miltoncostaea oceani]
MRKWLVIAALLIATLGVAACGGSDETSDGSPAAPAAAAESPGLDAGAINDLVATGELADWEALSEDDKVAVVERYLEVVGDTSGDPDQAATIAVGVDSYAENDATGMTLREVLDVNRDLLAGLTGGGTSFDTAACEQELGELITSLEEVQSRLSIGLPYADYRDRVADARVVYDRIDFDDVEPGCTQDVGVFVEQGLNRYIRAATRWGNCIEDFECDIDSIDPALQREWNRASDLIDRARAGLDS